MITLRRISENQLGTFGVLLDGDNKLCFTCERPWKDNEADVSCIPPGTYGFTRYDSPTKGKVWITQAVPGRTNIEIHAANFPSQLEGCIAVGDGFLRETDLTIIGVSHSRDTMVKLLNTLPDAFDLIVEAIS